MVEFIGILLGMGLVVGVADQGRVVERQVPVEVQVPVYVEACPDTVVRTITNTVLTRWGRRVVQSDTTTTVLRCDDHRYPWLPVAPE